MGMDEMLKLNGGIDMNTNFVRWVEFKDLHMLILRHPINSSADRYLIIECVQPPEDSFLQGKSFYDLKDHYEREDVTMVRGRQLWDGCSNWDTDYFLCCNRSQLSSLGEAMLYCYDWSKEMNPDWNLED